MCQSSSDRSGMPALHSPLGGPACHNEVRVLFTIRHLDTARPLFSSAHLDAYDTRPSYALSGERHCCLCGEVSPCVRGECEGLPDPAESHSVPTSFNTRHTLPKRFFSSAPPHLRADEECRRRPAPLGPTGQAAPQDSTCTSSPSSSFPWSLRYEVSPSSEGQRRGFAIFVSTEWLVEIRKADNGVEGSSVQRRPMVVVLALFLPPCGVYFRFFMNHSHLLVRLLRRVVDFSHIIVPVFYQRFESGPKEGSLEKRIMNTSSALERESVTKQVWEELKQEIKATLSFTKPLHNISFSGSFRPAPATNSTPRELNNALKRLMQADPVYTAAVVAGLVGSSDFAAIHRIIGSMCGNEKKNWLRCLRGDTSHVLPRHRHSRVIIFSTNMDKAESLLILASYFLHCTGSTRQVPSAYHHSSAPCRAGEEGAPRYFQAFEHAYAGINGFVKESGTGQVLPVDCGLNAQWVPLGYTPERAHCFLSSFSEDTHLLFLCPELGLCNRVELARYTLRGPLCVGCAGPRPAPFTYDVCSEETVIQDSLLCVLLGEGVRLHDCTTAHHAEPSFRILDALLVWLWCHQLVVNWQEKYNEVLHCRKEKGDPRCAREWDVTFPGATREAMARSAPQRGAWRSAGGLKQLLCGIDAYSSASSSLLPHVGPQLARLLGEMTTN